MDGDGHWLEIDGPRREGRGDGPVGDADASVSAEFLHAAMEDPRRPRQPARRPARTDDSLSGRRSYQRVEIDLADEDARLIWAEIWHPGRYDRGALSERFQFHSLIQETKVMRGARLVYRDRFHWKVPGTPQP